MSVSGKLCSLLTLIIIAVVDSNRSLLNFSRNDSYLGDICGAIDDDYCSVINEDGTEVGCDIGGLRIPGSKFPPTPKVTMEIWQTIDINLCPEDISITISMTCLIKIEYLGAKYEEYVTSSKRFALGFKATTTLISCKQMLSPLGIDSICSMGGYDIDISVDVEFTINIFQMYVDIVLNLHDLYPSNIVLWSPIAIGLPHEYMDILCWLSEMRNKDATSVAVVVSTDNDYCLIYEPTLNPTLNPTINPTNEPSLSVETTRNDDEDDNADSGDTKGNNSSNNDDTIISVTITISVVFICLLSAWYYFCVKRNKKNVSEISNLLEYDRY